MFCFQCFRNCARIQKSFWLFWILWGYCAFCFCIVLFLCLFETCGGVWEKCDGTCRNQKEGKAFFGMLWRFLEVSIFFNNALTCFGMPGVAVCPKLWGVSLGSQMSFHWWVYQLASHQMDTNFLNSKPPISTSHDFDFLKEACKTRAPVVPQRFPSRGAIPSGFPRQIESEHPPFFCRTHIPSHPAWQTSQSAVSLKMV